MRLALGLGFVLAAAAGCTAGGAPRDASTRDTGGGGMDAAGGMDAGPETCGSDEDCDDTFACTIDQCAVGGLCRHTPLDTMCMDGERCTLTMGCSTGCSVDADCQDGMFCNGSERCIAGDCFMGDPTDCSDGNDCTLDSCDDSTAGCTYEIAPGCDAGGLAMDAGAPCLPFDPSMHYTGTFDVLPGQSSSCGRATYNVRNVTFSISGGTLTVNADRFPLTQSPAPTGSAFDVQYVDSACNTYRLTGTFSCDNQFEGTWRTTPTGGCSGCSAQNATVIGVRR